MKYLLAFAICLSSEIAAADGFRDALTWQIMGGFGQSGQFASVPPKVKQAFAECMAGYVLAGFSASDRSLLDAYSKGQTAGSPDDRSRLDTAVQKRIANADGFTDIAFDNLSAICPADVPSFRQYFKPGMGN